MKLASAGCDIAAVYFSADAAADSLRRDVEAGGRRVCTIRGDVGKPESVDKVFETLRQTFDSINILVSNAASGVLRPSSELTLKHWRWCMETNALALNLFAQRTLPLMPAGGRIIALSSLGATRAFPDYGYVAASKAALESLVRTLAVEYAARGIRTNAVSAGLVDTEALQAFSNREELLAYFTERNPTATLVTAAQVADAVYLLCLPEAEMINGHTLIVDGGFSFEADVGGSRIASATGATAQQVVYRRHDFVDRHAAAAIGIRGRAAADVGAAKE
jgi:enoyl-[acyl-carrier protein] reductase III